MLGIWGWTVHGHALLGFADEADAGTECEDTFPLHHKGHTGSERQGNEGTLSVSDTGAFRSGDSEARGRVSVTVVGSMSKASWVQKCAQTRRAGSDAHSRNGATLQSLSG